MNVTPNTFKVTRKQSQNGSKVREVGYQSWTSKNLSVESYHNDILYYTCRWDALCPYIAVDEELLATVPKPFIVYALPPDSPFGVPINDKYGLVNVASEDFEGDPRRTRKFKDLSKAFRNFTHTETVVSGKEITFDEIYELGGQHFEDCYIDDREIHGFVDYVRKLDVLIIKVHSPEGELVLTDVSILLPAYSQVYGSFCQWNRAFKNKSPGLYACLLASRWAARNGYKFYNLGPVDDYGYKSLFVTDYEPIYALALADPEHPLAKDITSPLHTDFKQEEWNRIYRESVKHSPPPQPASGSQHTEPSPVLGIPAFA